MALIAAREVAYLLCGQKQTPQVVLYPSRAEAEVPTTQG